MILGVFPLQRFDEGEFFFWRMPQAEQAEVLGAGFRVLSRETTAANWRVGRGKGAKKRGEKII